MTSSIKPLPLTVIVPVKNEEHRLPACLASLEGVERVIVVDSASEDATRAVAEQANATVIDFHWDGGPIKKRNWVLQNHLPDSEWILFLDADERMTEALKRELAEVLPSTKKNAFYLRYSNYFMGSELRFGEPMVKLALLRRGHGKFEIFPENRWSSLDMEVHEHLIVDGEIGTLRSRVIHDDDKGVDAWFRRHTEYASWEAARYQAGPGSHQTLRQHLKYRFARSLLFPALYFVYAYILRGGFLDGLAGLRFAWAKSTYFAQIAIRIAEARKRIS